MSDQVETVFATGVVFGAIDAWARRHPNAGLAVQAVVQQFDRFLVTVGDLGAFSVVVSPYESVP